MSSEGRSSLLLCTLFVGSSLRRPNTSCFFVPGPVQFWFGSSIGYTLDKQRITTLEAWVLEIDQKSTLLSNDLGLLLQNVYFHLWEIWKHRSDVVMRHQTSNPMLTIRKIQNSFGEWSVALTSRENPGQSLYTSASLQFWQPPPPPFVKINVDGAWDEVNGNNGMGIIIRNHSGHSLAGASLHGNHNSAVEVEADAIVRGLQLAAFMKCRKIILESDCKEVICAMDNSDITPN
ncbi:uncharacterized protein LOC112184737 [Rosa chinensis]|uniref:uncharacterized protein LOC112184737 n=1 Tax=Rosa chinensis TaxID=74649 RepID=UPI000D08D43B|nr:uncharacterized protein LOC112184737 [Rosa chinensis]